MRASEWVLIGYFAYTTVLALVLPIRPPIPTITLVMNGLVFAGFALLVFAYELRRSEFFSIVRDWFPFPLMLLAYREMGWFARPHYTFELERRWILWDRLLLRSGLSRLIEAAGPVLPALLEISYSLVYTLGPFSVAMLYVYRRRERVDRFSFVFFLGVLLAYAQFPFWPSEPPRTVFPGEDFPGYQSVFRAFNWWMLGGYGIHTSVFPSAHVSGAFSAAFATLRTLPEHKWVGRFLLGMAVMIATATVYGRYHYAADALAGFGVALAAAAIARWRDRRSRPGA
jgi:membrane-associated phospholipid phosphatase